MKGAEVPESGGLRWMSPTTRRQLLERAGGAAALLALPTGLAGCLGGDEESGSDLTNLEWGLPSGLSAISYNDFSLTANYVAQLGLEGLLQLDYKGDVVEWLAESFENNGNQEFVFRLRDGVKWSDGSPMTIEDVLFQFEYNLNEKAQGIYDTYVEFDITSVEQTGPREITVSAGRPNPRVPALLFASQTAWFVKPSQLEDVGYDRLGSPGALPIGTGPYVFEEFVPDSSVTLTRNKHYWANDRMGALPETLRIRLIPEEAAGVLAARSGEISGALMIGGDLLKQYESIPDWTVYSTPGLDLWFFTINTRQAPFDDVHFRRAVAYSLDRRGIADAVWSGHARPATTLVPPETWEGFLSEDELRELESSVPTYDFDLDKARAELAQSKYADGFELTLVTANTIPQQSRIGQVLAQDLAKIGVRLNVEEAGESQWFAPLEGNKADDPKHIIHINDYPPESRDPSPNLYALLSSGNAVPGAANSSLFTNARVDRLLERQGATTDPKERAEYLSDVIRIAADQVPYIPIVCSNVGSATGPGLTFKHPNPWVLNGGAFPYSFALEAS